MERLDKILANTGRWSRKEARELVRAGRVAVDGVTAQAADGKYDPAARFEVDGETVSGERLVYLMLHKPAGLVSATEDPRQPTVLELLPQHLRRVGLFPAGRLDKDTEGLLLLTNDGPLAHRLLAPRHHVDKPYFVRVDGELDGADAAAFAAGMMLEDGLACLPAGLEVLEQFSDLPQEVPTIIISARDRESEKVRALDMGADDYVVKPFGVSELLARIRTTLRRADRLKMSQGAQRDVYQVQDLVVDITKHQVLLAGEQIHFTQNEFKILELLCIHAGKVLTYDFILEHVWGPYGGNNNNQILRVNMANIRRKLKEDPSKPKYIHTELGIGYRMLED